MKRRFTVVGLVVALMVTAGCSMFGPVKTPVEMSNQERAALVLILYNNAYANYNTQFAATPKPMDAATKQYFQSYKQVMEHAWPVISAFTSVVQISQNPTPEMEAEMIRLIYQLQAILMAKTS